MGPNQVIGSYTFISHPYSRLRPHGFRALTCIYFQKNPPDPYAIGVKGGRQDHLKLIQLKLVIISGAEGE